MIAFWRWENDEYDSDEPPEPCCHKFIAGDRVFTVTDHAYFQDQFGNKRPDEQMRHVLDKIAVSNSI